MNIYCFFLNNKSDQSNLYILCQSRDMQLTCRGYETPKLTFNSRTFNWDIYHVR